MGIARTAPGAARLPDGRVLIAGGYDGSDELASAEIFDPQTNSFSSAGVGSMAQKRSDLIAAPLPDGRVLVAGGFADGQALNSAEVFDPQTNSFGSAGIGSLGAARGDASGVALQDGRVLVAGGYGTDFLQTAEIYSATNTFASRSAARP
ncbi:MAG TPA: kelch repeat-containing protein [Solirubrobacterales bacterium]|nr:kelch repeat-containing protein [Solirubrobacterales bacterium]